MPGCLILTHSVVLTRFYGANALFEVLDFDAPYGANAFLGVSWVHLDACS